ncbi:hypothetical protein A2U01_0084554, partial [Trifolium medium]|nr:hypothetical protein [Trifolium medium]
MDSKVVMQAIQRHEYPRVYWGHVARNWGNMLAKLSNVSVSWLRRAGNCVAHNLARWASCEPNKHWISTVPEQAI